MAQPNVPEYAEPRRLSASAVLAACTIALGLVVLVGWAFRIEPLTRIIPGMVAMKPNAAFAFVLAGAALLLIRNECGLNIWALAISLAVTTIGAATLVEYVAGVDFGIDEILFRRQTNEIGSLAPNRMHTITAFDFVLLGLASALIVLDREHRAAQVLALIAALFAGSTLIGYLYGVREFVLLAAYHQMALHTTFGMLALSIAVLLARPNRGMMFSIADPGPSGVMARRLLPVAVLMPITLNGLAILAEQRGFFDSRFAAAVRVTLVVAIFVACIWRSAHSLFRMDQERQRADTDRLESERRFRFLAESLPQIVWISNPNGEIEYLNERWFVYTGLDRGPPHAWQSVLHPRDLGRISEDWQHASSLGERFHGEYLYRRHDGAYRWHLVHAEPLYNKARQLIQWVGTATDINDQKQAGEERYRSLVEATTAIVWNTPASGVFETDQPAWSAFTGQSFEKLAGWGWLEAIHPDDRPETARVWQSAVDDRGIYQVQHRIRRHDGVYRHMSVRAVPICDDDGSIREWIGIHTDIDDQQRILEDLKAAKEAAETANRAKAEFLANMSHEIRTPMNGVLGMTELALGTDLSPRQQEYLGLVKSSAEALLTVIDDILDFSKIEAGKLELDPVPFLLRDVVTDTLRCLASKAHEKGLELACRVAPNVPETIVGDSGRLRQVLVNLVGNAIKFTERGEVVVTVEVDSNEDSRATLRISVADSGIGIPAEKRDAVFAPFEQADGSTTRKYGGTGLGLTISARLIALMNGRIWVEANPIGGCIFRFTAQVETRTDSQATAVTASSAVLDGLRILIVDDNQTNRMILEEIVSQWGCRAVAVESGALALQELDRAAARGEPYVVVLLDMMMPEMDGRELARRIRSHSQHASARLLMLTSDGRDDLLQTRDRLIDGRLAKPVRQSQLLNAVLELFTLEKVLIAATVEPKPNSVPTGRSLRVLLAEDHPINQKVVARMLELAGHEITIASNGRLAVEAFLSSKPFDLIFMDVQMPEMDGFEAMSAIRFHQQVGGSPRVPIIALTAHAMAGDRERCLEAGFDDYLTKPIRAPALANVLERIANESHTDQSGSQEAPDAHSAFDLQAALDGVGGDNGLFNDILTIFLNYVPQFLTETQSAIDIGDLPALARHCHTLAGAAAQIAAPGIVAAARTLEALATNANLTAVIPAMNSLAHEVTRFQRAVSDSSLCPNEAGGVALRSM